MSPEVGTILALVTRRLSGGIAENGAAFAQGQLGLIGMMLSMSAKEYERGADTPFTENSDMRALFAELAPQVSDAALRQELLGAAAARDPSLRISDLNDGNYALRRLLTRLQVDAEEQGLAGAQRRIWKVLKSMAERRLVTLGP
jgi:hypothetical protein